MDHLLKLEFDIHRSAGTKHPLITKYGVDATPVAHADLDQWRHNFTGIQFLHKPTNLLVFGAIDDLWARPIRKGWQTTPARLASEGVAGRPNPSLERRGGDELEYIVVDYKATSKDEEITELNKDWQIGYKRQMEVYQWLLRQNGYKVSDTGYFVYCNGQTDREAFDGKLEFDVTLISYKGDDSWVEGAIKSAHKCLNNDKIPKAGSECDYCAYVKAVNSK